MMKELNSKELRIEQFKEYIKDCQREIELLEQRKQAIDLEISTLKEMQDFNLQMIEKIKNSL